MKRAATATKYIFTKMKMTGGKMADRKVAGQKPLVRTSVWKLVLPLMIFIFYSFWNLFCSIKIKSSHPDIYMKFNKEIHLSSFWHMWESHRWWSAKRQKISVFENAWNISGLMLPGNFFNHLTSSSVSSIPRISHKFFSKYPGLEHSLFYLGAIVWPHFRFNVNSDMILTSFSLLLSTTNQIHGLTPLPAPT